MKKNLKSLDKKNYLYLGMVLVLSILILAPILTIFLRALITDGQINFNKAFGVIFQKDNIQTILNSLILGVSVVILSTIIATPLAFILTRTKYAKSKWLDIILLIPFMTPPYIASMGWILFMQKRGLLQQLFPVIGDLSNGFFSLAGIIIVMSLHIYPFMTMILKNAILSINNSLEESAKVSGSGFWTRLKKITLPLLTGNYAIGMLLVFVKTLSEYGTPATLGKRMGFYVFTTDIHKYATIAPIDFGKASGLSAILVLLCLMMWYLQNHITTKNTYHLVGNRGNKQIPLQNKKGIKILSQIYIFFIILMSIIIPYFSVISTSLIKLRGYGLSKGNYTLDHYKEIFTAGSKGMKAISTSFTLAILAAIISSIIGLLIVTSIQKSKKWKKPIEGISLLPEMIPNIVLVIGFMILYNKIYRIIPIYNTLFFMVLVYSIMYLPFSISYISSSIMQLGDNLEDAAKIFGANKITIFKKIKLPLLMKGILSGAMMIFIISFRELVASSLISPPNVQTVSTYIVGEFEQGSVSVGMAMAVICVVLTTTALICINIFTQRKGPNNETN